MKTVQAQMLEALGRGVRPFDASAGEPPRPDGDGFSALLDDALGGNPRTELGVKFAPSVSGVYALETRHQIANAVDKAAASGVGHALILHDRHALRVDVRNRVVLEATAVAQDQLITGIDGFLSLGGPPGDDDDPALTPERGIIDAPARVVRNASLVHALAGRAAPV